MERTLFSKSRIMLNEFDLQYQSILRNISENGSREINKRTGALCISLPGQTMQFDLAAGFPLLTLRKIPLKLFIAEQVWFLMGERDLTWLQQFTRIWDDFSADNNEIESAYGYRWRHHFGRDQIMSLIALLTQDQTSRHGVIMMWDPSDDGLACGTKKANVPCPYTFTVQIIGGKLCLHLVIRSNDMMLGNPHDVAGFAFLAYVLAEKLNVPVGILTISISNAHIYGLHEEQAKELVERKINHESIKFLAPVGSFDRAINGETELVNECFVDLKSKYNPQPSLGRMNIVL